MERRMRIPLATLAAGILAVAGCGGGGGTPPPPNPLYVSVAGDDGNVGTRENPLRTIGEAASIALDGYAVIVGPGVYEEAVSTDRTGTPAQAVSYIADFTGELSQTNPGDVTIVAPLPQTQNSLPVAFKLNHTANTILDGFHITGGSGGGVVINRSPGARVQSCVIYDNKGNQGDGIRVQDSLGVTLFNNLVFGNSNAGISVVGQPGSPNAQLLNNTLYHNLYRGITVGTTTATSTGAFLRNNILSKNGDAAPVPLNIRVITEPPSTTGFNGDFNLVFPDTYTPSTLAGRNDINEDPRFANPDDRNNPDFRLLADSPAIDHGTNSLGNAELEDCLRQWSATLDPSSDIGRFDMGYHVPSGDREQAHCGARLPTPMPTPAA